MTRSEAREALELVLGRSMYDHEHSSDMEACFEEHAVERILARTDLLAVLLDPREMGKYWTDYQMGLCDWGHQSRRAVRVSRCSKCGRTLDQEPSGLPNEQTTGICPVHGAQSVSVTFGGAR